MNSDGFIKCMVMFLKFVLCSIGFVLMELYDVIFVMIILFMVGLLGIFVCWLCSKLFVFEVCDLWFELFCVMGVI